MQCQDQDNHKLLDDGERYPNLKEEVGGLIPIVKSPLYLTTTCQVIVASCAFALACRPSISSVMHYNRWTIYCFWCHIMAFYVTMVAIPKTLLMINFTILPWRFEKLDESMPSKETKLMYFVF